MKKREEDDAIHSARRLAPAAQLGPRGGFGPGRDSRRGLLLIQQLNVAFYVPCGTST
eukprot:NODE_8145_length_531_cov_2.539419_g7092_i0.p2 GENE.NODE_8145_length_531_cov_2.539419_g7092_i0~~NODE_8145_length_531_cov_2.539419_g7092_i0.p2  ORF type:complete len:57 (-),score=0.42 NODE_8145_length_531_cov_2.539419_g7092_i0:177-347(-)